MSQNRSHAVMAQRHEPHDSLDFFPTPPWATRALCEHGVTIRDCRVWDPACGRGDMVRPLAEYAQGAVGSDVHDYGMGFLQHDFLQPYMPHGIDGCDWVITNPPFRLGEQFARRAIAIAGHGVALLVRTSFLEGQERYRLFSEHRPAVIAQFVERVPMVRWRLDRTASTATAYAWIVWAKGQTDTAFHWIPPCRKRLERAEDYAADGVS
jgi:hypothetical protein